MRTQSVERYPTDLKPGDEFAKRYRHGVVGTVITCQFCGRFLKDRTEEWHWYNNCEAFQATLPHQYEQHHRTLAAMRKARDTGSQ